MFTRSRPTRGTDDELRKAVEQFELSMAELATKQPDEVAGSPMESVYYGLKVQEALDSGDEQTIRSAVERMLASAPTEAILRIVASMAYERLGEEAEAVAQLGIALGVDPTHYAVHIRLARLLLKRGERQAAAAILETGWALARKHVSRKDEAAERERYFSILKEHTNP